MCALLQAVCALFAGEDTQVLPYGSAPAGLRRRAASSAALNRAAPLRLTPT